MDQTKESLANTGTFSFIFRDEKVECLFHKHLAKSMFREGLLIAMKPILGPMSKLGLFHSNVCCVAHKTENWKTKCISMLTHWHCYLLVCILWFNVFRYIPSFWAGQIFNPNITVGRLIQFIWFLQCALNATILLVACSERAGFNKFFQMWDNMFNDSTSKSLNFSCKKQVVNFWSKFTLLVAISFTVINISLVSFILFSSMEEVEQTVVAILNPFTLGLYNKIIFVCLHFFDTVTWIFSIALFAVLSKALAFHFRFLSNILEDSIANSSALQTSKAIRQCHVSLCRMLAQLDKYFKLLLGVSYATNIPMASLILYQTVRQDLQTFAVAINLFWLSVNISNVLVISISSAYVNIAAHSPLEHIYDIQLEGATQEELGQLNLFLSKLTGTSIGFTALGLITVTKEVLLTIGGLYLTYFFLLLQFKIS